MASSTASPPPPRHRARLALEALEDRWLPALVLWTGLIDDDWNNALNWSSLQKPGADDDVIIATPGPVRYTGGDSAINSLLSFQELQVTAGKLTLGAGSLVARLTLQGGEIRANADLTVLALEWAEGTLAGTGTVYATGSLNLEGDGPMRLGTTLINRGSATWVDGDVQRGKHARFTNAVGATFTALASGEFEPAFFNKGTFELRSAGTARFERRFTNTGDVSLVKGVLDTQGTFRQTAGSLRLVGGSLSSPRPVSLEGGWLGGAGTVFASVFNTGGVVAPHRTDSTPHRLTIVGAYVQSSSGRLAIRIQGPAAKGAYDRLVVTGGAALGGALEVTLTGAASSGDVYQALTAGVLLGRFDRFIATAPPDVALRPAYTATRVTIVATTTTAAPRPVPVPAPLPEAPPAVDITPALPAPGAIPPEPGPRPAPGVTPASSPPVPTGGSIAAQTASGSPSAQPAQTTAWGAGGADTASMVVTTAQAASATTSRGEAPPAPDAPFVAPGGWAAGRPIGGGRLPPANVPEPAALADELFLRLPVVLPEVELPAEGGFVAASDLAAALLGTGRSRADLLAHQGSHLSAVGALVPGEEQGAGGATPPAASTLDALFLNPLELGEGPHPTPTPAGDDVAHAEEGVTGPRLVTAGLALAGVAGLALRRKRRRRKRTARPGLPPNAPR